MNILRDLKATFTISIFTIFASLFLNKPNFSWGGDDVWHVNSIYRHHLLENWTDYFNIASNRGYLGKFYSLEYQLFNGNNFFLALLCLTIRFINALIIFSILSKKSKTKIAVLIAITSFWLYQEETINWFAASLYSFVITLFLVLLYMCFYKKSNIQTLVLMFVLYLLSLNIYEILLPFSLLFLVQILIYLRSRTYENFQLLLKFSTFFVATIFHLSYIGSYWKRGQNNSSLLSWHTFSNIFPVELASFNSSIGISALKRVSFYVAYPILHSELKIISAMLTLLVVVLLLSSEKTETCRIRMVYIFSILLIATILLKILTRVSNSFSINISYLCILLTLIILAFFLLRKIEWKSAENVEYLYLGLFCIIICPLVNIANFDSRQTWLSPRLFLVQEYGWLFLLVFCLTNTRMMFLNLLLLCFFVILVDFPTISFWTLENRAAEQSNYLVSKFNSHNKLTNFEFNQQIILDLPNSISFNKEYDYLLKYRQTMISHNFYVSLNKNPFYLAKFDFLNSNIDIYGALQVCTRIDKLEPSSCAQPLNGIISRRIEIQL